MIRNREQFSNVCRKMAMFYMRLAGADTLPETDTMVEFSNVADDLTAYVSATHNKVILAHDGPRLAPAANVVRLADRRAR